MPKKAKLNDLLYDIDADFLREILLLLVESNPELEDRVRILITPKNQINNPLTYYKKQIKGLPVKINDKAKAKLTNEIIGKSLLTAREYEKGKNYFEATKVYQVILEVLIPKVANSDHKDLLKLFFETCEKWGKALSEVNDVKNRQISLEFLFKAKENKNFIHDDISNYFVIYLNKKPTISFTRDYYNFFANCCKGFTNKVIIDQIEQFLSKEKDPEEKYIETWLYLFKNRKMEQEFLNVAQQKIKNQKVMEILRDYFFEMGDFKNGLNAVFNHLDTKKSGFDFKNGEEVKIALDFLKLAKQHFDLVSSAQVEQVLIWLICTGNDQWVYDVSPQAQWWNYYTELKTEYPKNWIENYQKIIQLLQSKNLKKQILSICQYEEDAVTVASIFLDEKDIDAGFEIARIIYKIEPVKALEMFKRFIRYREFYFYSDYYEETVTYLEVLKKYLPADKLTDLDNLKKKIRTNKSQHSRYFS